MDNLYLKAKEMIKVLPRLNYLQWFKVVSAIGNTFDESTALDILLSQFKDEKRNEHQNKLKRRAMNIGFGTFVFICKQYGWKGYINGHLNNSYNFNHSTKNAFENILVPKQISSLEKHFRFDRQDYFEERANILEYENNVPRNLAEKIAAEELISKNEKCERLFDIMINKHIINKQPAEIIKKYQHLNEPVSVSISELIEIILNGWTFIPGHLDVKGNRRNMNDWTHSDLIVIDIDGGMTIDEVLANPHTKKASIIYTTPSHTQDNHRLRIIFSLKGRIYDKDEYKDVYQYIANIYRADLNTKDPARLFFGNTNAEIINLLNGELINRRNLNGRKCG